MTKASNLVKLRTAGVAVPPFIVIEASVDENVLERLVSERLEAAGLSAVQLFSVRSSATIEDGSDYSYAGQFESYIFVPLNEVVAKIKACRTSINIQDKVTYTGEGAAMITVDVIVQQMIDADVSGVAFSANPNGMINEAVIVVGDGAGTAVSDEVDTTTYYYHLDQKIYYHERTGNSPLLSSGMVTALIETLYECMLSFGKYIDIEFAIKNDTLWVLQVRPITTIKADDLVVFDNHNIVESYPGVCLPLTQSFVVEAYTRIFRRLLERSLGSKAADRYESTLDSMVRPVNGRMYYQVSSWYTILVLLPFKSKILKVWQEMVGVDVRAIKRDIQPRLRDRLKIIMVMLSGSWVIPKKMTQLHNTFLLIEQAFRARNLSTLSYNELLGVYDDVTKDILKDWDVTLSNDMYAFINTAIYKRLAGKDAELRVHRELPSTRLISDFNTLSKERLTVDDSTFAAHVQSYIDAFGDRVPGELKLETITFRQDRELLLHQLMEHRSAESEGVAKPTRLNPIVRYFQKRAAMGVYNRELSRLDRAKIFGMVREIVLAMGDLLVKECAIDSARDVFYLTLDELRTHTHGRSYQQRIIPLKRQYEALTDMATYSRLVFQRGVIVEKQVIVGTVYKWTDDATKLTGTPCSPGIIEAEAVVVNSLDQELDVRGKIVIAETTDPGWVFLLTQAVGIVAERGSLLSHTAIVSRELHKPSVVGVQGATRHIKTGDRVRIDGIRGIVEVVS